MSEDQALMIEDQETPKKSWVRKIMGWIVSIIILIVVAQFIAGLKSDQKARFVNESRQIAETACSGDATCLAVVKLKFESCLDLHSESHKSGKFGRKYTLHKEEFLSCLKL